MLRFLARLVGMTAAALTLTTSCHAQAPSSPDDQATLHVYVNLVQIPVLVLNQSLHPMDRIPDSHFNISVEGIGQIHPARIRLQGDDPINLALIVDRGVQNDSTWDELPKMLTPLIKALQPQDNFSVYAMDGCKAKRVGIEMAPFTENELRLSAMTVADMHPYKRDRHRKDDCPKPLSYWDMVTYAATRLAPYPGRKLVVTLSPGATLDAESATRIHKLLTDYSITLFPILHDSFAASGLLPYAGVRQIRSGNQAQDMALVNPGIDVNASVAMDRQAEMSGGVLLGTSQRDAAKTLAQPVLLARGRYIIEFPRPDTVSAGEHHIVVTDGRLHDFIRPAGISIPVANANEQRHLVMAEGAPDTGATSAADNASTTRETPAATRVDEKPVAPAISPAAQPAAAVPTKSVAARPPAVDPTDISEDLHPSH